MSKKLGFYLHAVGLTFFLIHIYAALIYFIQNQAKQKRKARQMYSFVCFVENLIYFQYKLLSSVNSIALQFIPNLCFRSA